jgi:hypothetical protein
MASGEKGLAKRHSTKLSRREALKAIACGAGALVVSATSVRNAVASHDNGDKNRQWLSWDDGHDYAILGIDGGGHWIIMDEEGYWTIDPSGWVYDGTWFEIAVVDREGIWYDGSDGYLYLVDLQAE